MKKLFTLFIFLCAVVTANADTWTVAGNQDLTGCNWDAGATANDMVYDSESGLWKWEKTDIILYANGSYEFKIVKDHSWSEAYPGSNWVINNTSGITGTGVYTVTITFNASSEEKKISVNLTKIDTWIVAGGKMEGENATIWTSGVFDHNAAGFVGDMWSATNLNNRLTATGEDHKWSKTYSNVPAGTYAFKVTKDCTWDNTAYPGNNYCFTLENASNVTILFNDDTHAVQVKIGDAYDGNWSVVGAGDLLGVDWQTDATSTNMQTTDNLNYYFYSCKYLKAGTYGYKILKNHDSAYKIAYPQNNDEITISKDSYYFIAIKYGPEPTWYWAGDTKPTLERLSAWTGGHSTYDSENDQTSFTPEAANEGIGFWIGNESTISADYLIFQTNVASKFKVNVQYVGENEGQIYTSESNPQRDYIIPLDANKKIVKVNLIQAGDKGSVTFTKFYFADAVATELKTAAGGYATFSSNENVAIPEGITAMYPTEVSDKGVITWKKFKNGIPARQGALLKGTLEGNADTPYTFVPTLSTDVVPDNATITMEPIPEKTQLAQKDGDYTRYILSKVNNTLGLYKVNSNDSWVNAGTAYLKVLDGTITTAPAFFPLTGETTAIDNLTTEPAAKGEEKIYSLDGRRIVGQPTAKGIYIVNGKKLLKK